MIFSHVQNGTKRKVKILLGELKTVVRGYYGGGKHQPLKHTNSIKTYLHEERKPAKGSDDWCRSEYEETRNF